MKEVRTANSQMEVRTSEDGPPIITGYALKFNTWSKPLGHFKETLSRDCLSGTDMTDTVALINHDYNLVLGRVNANLTLFVDDTGLGYTLEPTDTSYAKDLMVNMRAGVIGKCSFGFTIAEDGQEWRKNKDGTVERTITKIDKLYDISIVTDPAYDDTVADVRSWEKFSQKENDQYERELLDLDIQIYS